MESRRRGKEDDRNGSAMGGTKEPMSSDERQEARKMRKLHKQQYEKEKRHSDTVRWIAVVAVLILAAAGLYYYFAYYQPKLDVTPASQAKSARGDKSGTKAAKDKTSRGDPKAAKRTKDDGASEDDRAAPKQSKAAEKNSKGSEKAAAPKAKSKPAASDAEKNGKSKKNKGSTATKSSKAKAEDGRRTGNKKESKRPAKTGANSGRKNYSVREDGVLREEVNLEKIRLLRRPIGPSDPDRPYIVEILKGDNFLRDERWNPALETFNEILKRFPKSPRAIYGKGIALEHLSRQKKSNKLLDTAIEFYQKAGLETFQAKEDLKVASLMRLADLAAERNQHQLTLKALEKLQEIRGRSPAIANRLGLGYLYAGHNKKAKTHFKRVLEEFPDNHFAKAHLGFLFFLEKRYEEALPLLLEGIHRDESIKTNAKFYLYAGECLLRLERTEEAYAIYGEAVSLDLIPSVWQRSLYNEPDLTARGWWTPTETSYQPALERIEKALENITPEAISLLDGETGAFPNGNTHFVLYSKGKRHAENCGMAPLICALIESFPEALTCRRGEVKLTVFPPRSHILPRVGPTNTRLEVVAGLRLDKGLKIRVAEESRVLEEGQMFILDDSFEQELWYDGSETGIVLTMDVWHPDLSEAATRKLSPLT